MFVDYAKIKVIAGKGGNGCISFRREKYVPKGGPDGGNGGRGGHVIFKVNSQLHTLQDIKYQKRYRAGNGQDGSSGRKTGRNGRDVYIFVPKGTMLKRFGQPGTVADLVEEKDKFIAARGGRGGRGNSLFATSTRQHPDMAESGKPGEKFIYEVELKLLAEVGIIGLPNAGKSTLLSVLSAARPKVADYPFTTLHPHLGIVKYRSFRSFVMADIPGLIKDASKGKGLGINFLKHIERTTVLVFLIESIDKNIIKTYKILMGELENYNLSMKLKPRVIAISKMDLLDSTTSSLPKDIDGIKVFPISSITGKGIGQLIKCLIEILDAR